MKTNQAFEILKNAGGIRAARIIIQNRKNLPFFWVLYTARKLRHNVPVAKIIHEKWFYGLPFYTNKWTLDPRPDSETLVEAVLKNETHNEKLNILDLGTGTGCLIASIVKNIPNAHGVAIDKSRHAVNIAKRNVNNLELKNRIKIMHASFSSKKNFGKFDVIISNPPYIVRNDKRVDDGACHDPAMALYAKNNGLAAYEIIAKNAKRWLQPNGKIYLEIGVDQGLDIREIFAKQGWAFFKSFNDLSNIERILCFSK
ncbi:MAG: peptide chain release factor N(5)-glutamine methyltransferase [Bacteroidales bacterium]|nr:peptide chain release factor N(5)-glutamine methyltransferase [Bacteroidales bacterium]